MEEKIKLIRYRNLKETYTIVYAFKNEVKTYIDEKITTTDLYTLIGVDMFGNRYILDIIIDNKINNRIWLDAFESLKARGIKRIFFITIKEDKNVSRALRIVFPDTILVVSLTDTINNIYKYVGFRGKNSLVKQLKDLCVQPSIEQFQCEVDLIQEYYSNNYIVTTLINGKLVNIKLLYEYDENVRRLIFNHNKNLEFYDKINKYQKINCINNIDEVWAYLYEYIIYTEQYKSFTKNTWTQILNSLMKLFNDEIIEAIKE